ncbi:hypothetical protein D6C98_04297 [Aureobasidium pullulans]|nr:hypothetical protein D6C98_04297 [Aureobasidium pullulans]
MSRPLFAAVIFAASFVSPSTATGAVVLDATFDVFVQQLCDALHVPGLSLAVVHRDSIESKGYGYATLPDVEATPDTLWYTGSTTKAFTAAAAALIVQDPLNHADVSWSSPVSQLLPGDFTLSDDYYTSHISLEDALSHRSGLPRHDLAYGWDDADTLDMIRTMRHLPLTAEPRTKFQYSNLMYATIGAVLERLTKLSFGQVLRTLIWEPIGMISTTASLEEAKAARDSLGRRRLSKGYFWHRDHHLPEPYEAVKPMAGAGATISSVNDYALWVQALLNAGRNHSSPVSDRLFQDITAPRTIIDNAPGVQPQMPLLYALGWFVVTIGSHRIITHSGAVPGFGANVYLLPDEGLGFVSMANTAGTSNVAGAILFNEILKRSGKMSPPLDVDPLTLLLQDPIMFPGRPGLQHAPQNESQDLRQSIHPVLPLPGLLQDYAGLYSHPAYGIFNVSLEDNEASYLDRPESTHQRPVTASSGPISLRIQPSKRTWPVEFVLTHESNTLFAATVCFVHGQGDVDDGCAAGMTGKRSNNQVRCRNEVFVEPILQVRAVFEYNLKGEVAKLGVELEAEMLVTREDDWRNGMIWFVKQE